MQIRLLKKLFNLEVILSNLADIQNIVEQSYKPPNTEIEDINRIHSRNLDEPYKGSKFRTKEYEEVDFPDDDD